VRVGVTGSRGFIGRALVAALRERGDEVVAFVRPGGADVAGPSIRWDPSRDLVDEGDLNREGGLDAVVHLAGVGLAQRRWSVAQKAAIVDSRVRATTLLVGVLGSRGSEPPFLASASAVGFYGDRGEELLDESAGRGTGFLADLCVAWEAAASSTDAPPGARLRSGLVLGANGGALARQLPLFRVGLGGTLGDGRQWLSPISLVDHVRAIQWILDRRLAGPLNLTGPRPATNREFTRALGAALGRPSVVRVPSLALAVVLGRQLSAELVLASQRVIPHALSESGFDFRFPDVESALAEALTRRR
jgi:uncharacterized protein (TIGR01777 family)